MRGASPIPLGRGTPMECWSDAADCPDAATLGPSDASSSRRLSLASCGDTAASPTEAAACQSDGIRCYRGTSRVTRVATQCFSVANAMQGLLEREARWFFTRFQVAERGARLRRTTQALPKSMPPSRKTIPGLAKRLPGVAARCSCLPARCSDCPKRGARWVRT